MSTGIGVAAIHAGNRIDALRFFSLTPIQKTLSSFKAAALVVGPLATAAVAVAVVAGFFSAFLAGSAGVATGFLAGVCWAAPGSFAGGSFAGGSCANEEAFNTNTIKKANRICMGSLFARAEIIPTQ